MTVVVRDGKLFPRLLFEFMSIGSGVWIDTTGVCTTDMGPEMILLAFAVRLA